MEMGYNFEKEYSLITGETYFGKYTTPEEQANSIEKCSILKRVNLTFTDRVIENNNLQRY